MRAKRLKELFLNEWSDVESSVRFDIDNKLNKNKRYLKFCDTPEMRGLFDVIAFNAAFAAVSMLHKELKRRGIRVVKTKSAA